jgi:hypothetical protein
MTTVSLSFANEDDAPMFIQVDPWAGIYRLAKNESIEFVAESETNEPRFGVLRGSSVPYLTILDSTGYFVVVDGRRLHWTDFPANFSAP